MSTKNSPGTSDNGQLAASTTPYLPPRPVEPEYTPPPSPQPVKGPEVTPQVNAQKAFYRQFSADSHGFEIDPKTGIPSWASDIPSSSGIPKK